MSVRRNRTVPVVIGIVVLCVVVFGGLRLTRNFGKTGSQISAESATQSFDSLYKRISPKKAKPVKASVDVDGDTTAAEELPDLKDDDYVIAPPSSGDYVEIWSSGEKAGDNTDGYLKDMIERFNDDGVYVNGKKTVIALRSITSGQAVDYMASGKATPTAYTPSNALFVKMLNARGVATTTVTDKLVGNVAGIVLKKDAYKKVEDKYGSVNLKTVTQAVADGKLQFGYSNPFTSASGMNFLITTLERYDASNPLSDTATNGFKKFQQNVPLVATTTQQMRNASDRNSLDGFITERQVYDTDATLQSGYKFVAFGYRHDNPLVSIDAKASDQDKAVLQKFVEWCKDNGGEELAKKDGFDDMGDYVAELPDVDGKTLLAAQQLYKENKNADSPVVAVFVADTSGSMGGKPIAALKKSLVNGMKYIGSDSYVGLVSYSDDVTINVPIAKFDMTQKSLFKGGVESLQANGGTATFNGIAVAGKMISDALKNHPDAKPMIFVLSDGETNEGYSLDDVKGAIQGLHIPIYTIGYNADISALKKISDITEAASINADTDDVTYQIKTLFNANL
jgi:Ca-activated chloride channel family protein